MQSLLCNCKISFPWKGCLSNCGESWFGQPVSGVHILRCFYFILKEIKLNILNRHLWLTEKFKQVSWLEISTSNFNYNIWLICEITEVNCLASQPLFNIKFHKWNQLVESILHIKDVDYLFPHYNWGFLLSAVKKYPCE